MTAEEWLKVIEQADDYTEEMKEKLTPLIRQYGEMCANEAVVAAYKRLTSILIRGRNEGAGLTEDYIAAELQRHDS